MLLDKWEYQTSEHATIHYTIEEEQNNYLGTVTIIDDRFGKCSDFKFEFNSKPTRDDVIGEFQTYLGEVLTENKRVI